MPNFQYLICDEAHSIEDIATDYFGDTISKYKFHSFIKDIEAEIFKDQKSDIKTKLNNYIKKYKE